MNKNISELFGPIMEQEQAETHSIFCLPVPHLQTTSSQSMMLSEMF